MGRPGEGEEVVVCPNSLLGLGLGLGPGLGLAPTSKGDCKGARAMGLPLRGSNDDVGEPCLLGEDKGE